jgi:hypothetical protein
MFWSRRIFTLKAILPALIAGAIVSVLLNGGQTWRSQQLTIEGRPEIIRFLMVNTGG